MCFGTHKTGIIIIRWLKLRQMDNQFDLIEFEPWMMKNRRVLYLPETLKITELSGTLLR